MKADLFLNKEEKLIFDLLFSKKKIDRKNFTNINFEKFVKISSEHLLIPSLYVKLRNNSQLNLIPVDLGNYMLKIYKLNRDRNLQLIDELNFLAKNFSQNKIDYAFLKGSALILGDFYEDVGERMIGDIDFLYRKDQKPKLEKLLSELKYKTQTNKKYDYAFRHLPRRINALKLFAVEPHSELINKRQYLLNSEKILNNVIFTENGLKISNSTNTFNHLIYNDLFNDNGDTFLRFSYKNYYDLFSIKNKKPLTDSKVNRFNHNFFFFNEIFNMNLVEGRISSIKYISKKIRYLFIKKFRFYKLVDIFLCKVVLEIKWRKKQLYLFITSSNYRNYIKKKILKLFSFGYIFKY